MEKGTEDVVYNPVNRERITFLDTHRSTGGKRTRFRVEVQPGGGVETHYHRSYDERIEATQGIVDVEVDGERRRLSPGEYVMIRTGQSHRFWNASNGVMHFEVLVEPASEGYEMMLRGVHGIARDGGSNKTGIPKDLRAIAVLAKWGDTRLVGAMRLLVPVLGVLHWLARRAKLDADLYDKYGESQGQFEESSLGQGG